MSRIGKIINEKRWQQKTASSFRGFSIPVVIHTYQNLLESFDCFFQRHQLACMASKDLSHLEGLGQKSLDLTGTCHCQLILFRQFIHTQNSDNVLEGFVVLERKPTGELRQQGHHGVDQAIGHPLYILPLPSSCCWFAVSPVSQAIKMC